MPSFSVTPTTTIAGRLVEHGATWPIPQQQFALQVTVECIGTQPAEFVGPTRLSGDGAVCS